MTRISPQLVVCTRCRGVLADATLRLRHLKHAYCEPCAVVLGLAEGEVAMSGIERDPKKWGGHTYRGPR